MKHNQLLWDAYSTLMEAKTEIAFRIYEDEDEYKNIVNLSDYQEVSRLADAVFKRLTLILNTEDKER